MRKRRRLIKLLAAGLIAFLLAGCGSDKPSDPLSIDPPPFTDPTGDVLGAHWDAHGDDASSGTTAPVTLYVKDQKGLVAPVTMKIPMTTPDIAQRALEYMIEGST